MIFYLGIEYGIVHNANLDLWGTDQFLNQISTLILVEKWVENVKMINQKSTSQPQINQFSTFFQPYFNIDILTSNLVDFCLNCGWEVDFWLIIITFPTYFSTKYQRWGWLRKIEAHHWINVDSTLSGWSLSIGEYICWSRRSLEIRFEENNYIKIMRNCVNCIFWFATWVVEY